MSVSSESVPSESLSEIHHIDEPEIEYYENGQIKIQSWWENGQLHRIDKPAVITYYGNGQIKYQAWWENGQRHRKAQEGEDGSAEIEYYENGQIKRQAWWENGHPHRIGEPAEIEYYENGQIKNWLENGQCHE